VAKKKMDRNLFLRRVAPKRCDALARKELSTRDMKLRGVDDFDGAMEAICGLFKYAYSQGITDGIDALIDGRDLEPVKE
jgi:hypothetical protein